MKLFQRYAGPRRAMRLQETTLSDFGGGLNTIDEDLGMSMKYQRELKNFRRLPSGSQTVRWGSVLFADVSSVVGGVIVDSHYFGTRLLHVTSTGEIATVTDDGDVEAIWNTTIAASLPSAPAGWSATTQVDFVPFRDTVVIHNGVDKPVRVNSDYTVEYDVDDATGSNVNYPIGKFGCTVANYHVVAGIPASPTEVYVSSKGTSGVWPGDPSSNAISIDVGAYAPEGGNEIVGVAGFRSQLLVFFPKHTLVVTLGTLNADEEHEPQFPDSLPEFGVMSHRCIVSIAGDIIFADADGVNSAKRNLFSGLVEPSELSSLISPTYRSVIATLEDAQARSGTFAIHDHIHNDVIVFEPGGVTFTYSFNDRLKYASWSHGTHRDYTSACVSQKGRVFLTKGTKVYKMGNTEFGEPYRSDEMEDYDYDWTTNYGFAAGDRVRDSLGDGEIYLCLTTHTSGTTTFADDRASYEYWEVYEGFGIPVRLELPWMAGEQPLTVKNLRFVSVAARGSAHLDLKLWVDDLYLDDEGEIIHDPELELTLVGNDYRGAGFDVASGGARKTGGPKLYKFPAKFKKAKFVLEGEATAEFTLSSLSFLFARGKFKR